MAIQGLPHLLLHARNDEKSVVTLVLYAILDRNRNIEKLIIACKQGIPYGRAAIVARTPSATIVDFANPLYYPF